MIKLYKKSRQARHWIKYAVIPSFIPIILIVIYDIILGYTMTNIINKHLVDFILVVFAVAVSVFSSAITLNKKVNKLNSDIDEEKSDNYVLYAIVVGGWCTALFTFLYDKLKPEDSLSFKKIVFCFVQVIITYFIIYQGMQTENELELLSQTPSTTNNNLRSHEVDQSDAK